MRPTLNPLLAGIAAVFTAAAAAARDNTTTTTTTPSAFPTVNMFINDGFDGHAAYAGSIIAACSEQTIYALHCTSAPASIGTATCGPNAPIVTVTEGPNTYVASTAVTTAQDGYTAAAEGSEGCALLGTTAASCVAEFGLSAQGTSTTTTKTTLLTGAEYHRFDVAITGGAEKTASATEACTAASSGAMTVSARGGLVALGVVLAASFVEMVIM